MSNLLSNDVNRFDRNLQYIPYVLIAPLQAVTVTLTLWHFIGPSALAGVLFLFLLAPGQGTR
jgi:hypothetical protein